MKIDFADKSYINIQKTGDKITITISAKDYNNPLKKISNSVEITEEEFKKLISDI